MAETKSYLKDIETKFIEAASSIDRLDDNDEQLLEKLSAIVAEAVAFEELMRAKYKVGVRFTVIANQLDAFHSICQHELDEVKGRAQRRKVADNKSMSSDEVVIYIYLFNAQGKRVASWKPLLSPKALMDHSINRPIYAHEAFIQELIRSKPNPVEHAYVKAVVKKSDILMSEENSILKDKIGNPMIRIKHGALRPSCIREFYHNGRQYPWENNSYYKLPDHPSPEDEEGG